MQNAIFKYTWWSWWRCSLSSATRGEVELGFREQCKVGLTSTALHLLLFFFCRSILRPGGHTHTQEQQQTACLCECVCVCAAGKLKTKREKKPELMLLIVLHHAKRTTVKHRVPVNCSVHTEREYKDAVNQPQCL